ncbi:hypothetical protein Tco_0889401 [Tanacetum coccineum]
MGDDVDISMLTIEQYLALIQDNNRLGIVKPEISNDVEFKINSNFMRELRRKLLQIDETLYHAWERYSDLLYRCLQHDLNCQQKVHIFYTGLDISTRRMLDSRGFITLITPTQALISIQVMADHSHNCFKEAHPTKECPLKKEDKAVEQSEKVKVRTTMSKESVKEPVPRDLPVVQTYAPPTPFLGHLNGQMGSPYRTHKTVYTIGIPEEVHKLRLRRMKVHIIPPDDDYVAPTTSPSLDMQLNEFRKDCSDITKVAEMAYGNLIKDIKELSDIIKTSDFETFVEKLLH